LFIIKNNISLHLLFITFKINKLIIYYLMKNERNKDKRKEITHISTKNNKTKQSIQIVLQDYMVEAVAHYYKLEDY